MNVTIKLLREDWADPSVPLPAYQTAGAAGADLCANLPPGIREEGLILPPMGRAICPTGLRVQIPEGYEMQVRPRSGLSTKHGISMPNTPGTVDSDYRGPLGVPLINLGPEAYTIRHGERVAQAVIAPVLRAGWEVVAALDETARGEGGFGSTGKG
ncbi:dUTP diphosphatase [Pseudogemmobacter sonorensis]|uniref:dUTP diphosphatase n=1 Tax=Pseudogemmobacter sonorensis TaxID=2989681 RepID=UPI0036C1C9A7